MAEREHETSLSMLQAEHAPVKPTVSIQIKDVGPEGVLSAETLAGFPSVDHPADIAAAQLANRPQPKPVAASKSKSTANSG